MFVSERPHPIYNCIIENRAVELVALHCKGNYSETHGNSIVCMGNECGKAVGYGLSRNDPRDFKYVNIYSSPIRLLYIG